MEHIIQDGNRAMLYNTSFVQQISTKDGLEKMAGLATDFCRIKIREEGLLVKFFLRNRLLLQTWTRQ